jgi:hypothetical protein
MSAEEIHKHKPKDIKPQGMGSGLDADKVDGLHASDIGGGAPHNILSATHSDALVDAVIRGDIIIGNSTPKWSRLPIGLNGKVLRSDGVDPSWAFLQAADIPDLPASKITSEILAAARGGLGKSLLPTWTNDYILVYKTATDNFVMEAKPSGGGQPADWVVLADWVASANCDYVDFTGLDINSHRAYMLFFKFKNQASGGCEYNIFVEADYTEGNYCRQMFIVDGSSLFYGRADTVARFAGADNSGNNASGFLHIQCDVDGILRADTLNSDRPHATLRNRFATIVKDNSVSNITQIRIAATAPNGIGAGSRIVLCKVKA